MLKSLILSSTLLLLASNCFAQLDLSRLPLFNQYKTSMGLKQASFKFSAQENSANILSDGVPGQFYASNAESLSSVRNCPVIVQDLENEIVRPLSDEGFYVDYTLFCMPSGNQSYVYHDVRVEPNFPEDSERLQRLLKKLEGKIIDQVNIHFDRVVSMKFESFFRMYNENGEVQYWERPFSVAFDSYIVYRKYMKKENEIFYWNPSAIDFYDFVATKLTAKDMDSFTKNTAKADTIGSVYWPIYTLENGKTKTSNLGLGNNRICLGNDTPCTLN